MEPSTKFKFSQEEDIAISQMISEGAAHLEAKSVVLIERILSQQIAIDALHRQIKSLESQNKKTHERNEALAYAVLQFNTLWNDGVDNIFLRKN